ncbi:MAG: molybdopterin-dependent oxidoreductase [Pseudomonadota bacterium]
MALILRTSIAVVAFALCGLVFAAADDANAGKFITEKVVISGLVEHQLNLTVSDLRSFPSEQIVEVPFVRQSGSSSGKPEKLKGVLLSSILGKAAIISRHHNDIKKMAVVATASDGYAVVFSWSEVYNSAAGEGIIVFFERNGLPLADDEGRIAMMSTKDIRTGPRHVRWLQTIEIKKIAE